MAIFTDAQLEALFEENGISKRVSDNTKKIKDFGSDIKDNLDNNIEGIKSNIKDIKDKNKKKKGKKSFQLKVRINEDGEYVAVDDEGYLNEKKVTKLINGKNYRPLSSIDYKYLTKSELKKTITVNGTEYISDDLADQLAVAEPEKRNAKIVSTGGGAVLGAMLGGISGAPVSGAVLGGSLANAGYATLDYWASSVGKEEYYKRKAMRKEGFEFDESDFIEEITKDGKKYRRLKSGEEAHVSPKDIIIIGGKKYIYDIKDSINNPVRTAGEKIGDYTGGAIGGAVGGAVGSAAGPVGTTVGTYVGSKIGSGWGEKSGEVVGTAAAHTKIGKSITNGVRKGISSATKSPKRKVTRESVYRSPEYTKAMNEYFDIDHKETRDILLAVNEDDQSKVLVSLTSKLYENIIDKVDDIDFGEIPMTKGDITKLSNYQNLCDCCDTMSKILIEYKQDTKPIDTVITAIRNIEDSTDIWKRAFSGNIELPMVVYNTTVLAIIEATSYLISMCVEFIKVPSSDTFQIMIDKSALSKTKGHMVFENLEKFNDAYRKGQIKNAMNYVIKENVKNFAGTTIGAGAALIGITSLLFIIIPIIRELIFLFYYSRVRVADYFEVQADMLQINAYNVENNRMDLTKEQKKNITTKQIKIADKFRKFSNNIAVSAKESEIKASKEISNQNKKYKVSDVMDEMPDSASSALF